MAVSWSRAFIDTGVFVSGIIDVGDDRGPEQRLLDELARGRVGTPKTAWHCCLEFFSVTTRLPEGLRIAPADAARLVEEEIIARCEVLELPKTQRRAFWRDAAADRVAGGRIYDQHIAAVARAGGAQVVITENRRHFTALLRHGIRVLTPEEFAEDVGV